MTKTNPDAPAPKCPQCWKPIETASRRRIIDREWNDVLRKQYVRERLRKLAGKAIPNATGYTVRSDGTVWSSIRWRGQAWRVLLALAEKE